MYHISISIFLFGRHSEVYCGQHKANQERPKTLLVLKTGTRNQNNHHKEAGN
jgi:hypothetical protein